MCHTLISRELSANASGWVPPQDHTTAAKMAALLACLLVADHSVRTLLSGEDQSVGVQPRPIGVCMLSQWPFPGPGGVHPSAFHLRPPSSMLRRFVLPSVPRFVSSSTLGSILPTPRGSSCPEEQFGIIPIEAAVMVSMGKHTSACSCRSLPCQDIKPPITLQVES
ncbi:uncharacterized protein K489DRAFT_162466 [Dissoconium aciculare CBS 342.82]|uniref:Uncharacterized protein n=1 Tax=Dissoconium aciculare CBS 342.82 TaxID=1314786 RepID=A0A6J3MCI8_9PEZI|nr:uncharacterized protein K489DRAFT_162466 [Dissoconium aciculare CBS 342.82]KAF1825593.1 hypothetical protein K489DRAFT_162466 [Dissoconium aciculare CBS 342.82]